MVVVSVSLSVMVPVVSVGMVVSGIRLGQGPDFFSFYQHNFLH
jgi:hypothetical protein